MGSRNCCYCGKELTDAASMEAGIGPVCRKMENHVLAQLIPANVLAARRAFKAVKADCFPEEAQNTLLNVGTDLEETNNDWRKTVKRIEWLLSFVSRGRNKAALIEVVMSLGYVSLASLLSGEAAKGLCTVTFVDGRLYLKGPNNKHGRMAIKAVQGRKYHSTTKSWSVPAARYAEFKEVIWKHWPKNEGLSEALMAAQEYTAEQAEAKAAESEAPAPKTLVVATKVKGTIKVASPYNKGFVTALKGQITTWKDRRWNPSEKVWEVSEAHADLLSSLVEEFYGEKLSL